MTIRTNALLPAAVLAIALACAIAIDDLGFAESTILTGFGIVCISLISFGAEQTVRARVATYGMLAVGGAAMFAPIALAV